MSALRREISLLEDRLANDRPTLGICLGSQLIARALGARVFAGPIKEIGWGRVTLTSQGRASCLAPLADDGAAVLHWHSDTFDLPQGVRLLASSTCYDNQAFSHGSSTLALQFPPSRPMRARWSQHLPARRHHWRLSGDESPPDGPSPEIQPSHGHQCNGARLMNVDDETLCSRRIAMQVQEIMRPNVHMADPNMTIREVARRMRANNIGALPVGVNDRLIGMVTDRDIVVRAIAEDRSPGDTTVREVMSEGVCYCFEDDDVARAAEVMAKYQVRRLPVIDRGKRLVGFVALADLGRSEDKAAQGALKGISEPTDKERRYESVGGTPVGDRAVS